MAVRESSIDRLDQTLFDYKSNFTELETRIAEESKSAVDKLAILDEAKTKPVNKFKVLANQVFNEKGKAFSERNCSSLDGVLNPMREQQSKPKLKHNDRMALWMLLLVVVVIGAVFLWTSSNYQQGSATEDTHVDAKGRLHVLGVTLGETNLNQAELVLQSKSDVALYIYPQEHPKAGLKLEAFFPAIADHTKVVLLMDLDDAQLKAIESRATVPHLYENKVARMNLAAADVSRVHSATVRELTLIPNLTISPETLKARFGEPDRVQSLDKDRDEYIYDAIGLKAVISKDEPPVLHFANPG